MKNASTSNGRNKNKDQENHHAKEEVYLDNRQADMLPSRTKEKCRLKRTFRLSGWTMKGVRYTTTTKIWNCSSHLCRHFRKLARYLETIAKFCSYCRRHKVCWQRILHCCDSFQALFAALEGPKFGTNCNRWEEKVVSYLETVYCRKKSWITASRLYYACLTCGFFENPDRYVECVETSIIFLVKPL